MHTHLNSPTLFHTLTNEGNNTYWNAAKAMLPKWSQMDFSWPPATWLWSGLIKQGWEAAVGHEEQCIGWASTIRNSRAHSTHMYNNMLTCPGTNSSHRTMSAGIIWTVSASITLTSIYNERYDQINMIANKSLQCTAWCVRTWMYIHLTLTCHNRSTRINSQDGDLLAEYVHSKILARIYEWCVLVNNKS